MLAIDGGQPIHQAPLAPWPAFDEEMVEAAAAVLRSGKVNYWTGQEGRRFEKEFAAYCGCEHAVAVSNGTVALEFALQALGVGSGDEVVVTSRTFVASASSIVTCGARPVFADVDADSQNITAASVEAVLTPKTKAVIAVHLGGWPCEMDALAELAKRHDLKLIEDAAQAHGAEYQGRPVGSWGDIAAFSFCQDKILTTGGEGGMIVTNDGELWRRAWGLKDHGKNWETVYNKQHPPGFRWLHEDFGTNGRMTEMQSAIGRVLLKRLPAWVQKRREAAASLNQCFANISALRITEPPESVLHAYYKYYVFVKPDQLKPGWDRDRIMRAVCDEGIPCYSGSCSEIYRELAFEKHDMQPPSRLTVARSLGETSLMFLVHPTLSAEEIQATQAAVEKVMKAASVSV